MADLWFLLSTVCKYCSACLVKDKELLPIVYKHQARSHLEYGNAIWHSRYIGNMKKVGVQGIATKLIPELRDNPQTKN